MISIILALDGLSRKAPWRANPRGAWNGSFPW
jgi:hypothetical protein